MYTLILKYLGQTENTSLKHLNEYVLQMPQPFTPMLPSRRSLVIYDMTEIQVLLKPFDANMFSFTYKSNKMYLSGLFDIM